MGEILDEKRLARVLDLALHERYQRPAVQVIRRAGTGEFQDSGGGVDVSGGGVRSAARFNQLGVADAERHTDRLFARGTTRAAAHADNNDDGSVRLSTLL